MNKISTILENRYFIMIYAPSSFEILFGSKTQSGKTRKLFRFNRPTWLEEKMILTPPCPAERNHTRRSFDEVWKIGSIFLMAIAANRYCFLKNFDFDGFIFY